VDRAGISASRALPSQRTRLCSGTWLRSMRRSAPRRHGWHAYGTPAARSAASPTHDCALRPTPAPLRRHRICVGTGRNSSRRDSGPE
jgi:hypothetical protein